jgi:hypothetical protein
LRAKDSPADTLSLDDLQPEEAQQFSGFYGELLDFGNCMSSVSLATIDIFFPGLKADLLNVIGRDMRFSYIYTTDIAPNMAWPIEICRRP